MAIGYCDRDLVPGFPTRTLPRSRSRRLASVGSPLEWAPASVATTYQGGLSATNECGNLTNNARQHHDMRQVLTDLAKQRRQDQQHYSAQDDHPGHRPVQRGDPEQPETNGAVVLVRPAVGLGMICRLLVSGHDQLYRFSHRSCGISQGMVSGVVCSADPSAAAMDSPRRG